jgi:hypothetical protein
MKNDFSDKARDLFDLGGYCRDWEDGRNDADCLHHILGRVSNSPYNACPLNNFRNHQPEGRMQQNLPAITSKEAKLHYLIKTKAYLDSLGYKPDKKDLEFLEANKEYYKND